MMSRFVSLKPSNFTVILIYVQGQFFPFFILTISALVTLPLAYSLLKPSKGPYSALSHSLNTRPSCSSWNRPRNYRPPNKIGFQTTGRGPHPGPEAETMAAGEEVEEDNCRGRWVSYHGVDDISDYCNVDNGTEDMGSIQHTTDLEGKCRRPGVASVLLIASQSSTEQAIKKRYKDLSRTFHPDKARPDPSKNQTIEDINDYWVELSKAYKALTDEEVRNNFIQHGHPDGKQGFSIGIALPQFIVTEGNGKYVLLVYGLLLGVLLPYYVGKWWYGTQRLTREKVLLASAGNLFKEYKEDMTERDVISALSCGEEFKEVLSGNKADAGLGKVEKAIAPNLTSKDRQKLESYDGARRKAVALLWAYLGRIRLDGSTLDDGQYTLAPPGTQKLTNPDRKI